MTERQIKLELSDQDWLELWALTVDRPELVSEALAAKIKAVKVSINTRHYAPR